MIKRIKIRFWKNDLKLFVNKMFKHKPKEYDIFLLIYII